MISLAYKLFHGGVGQVHGRFVCDELVQAHDRLVSDELVQTHDRLFCDELVQAHGRLVCDELVQVHGDDGYLTLAHMCVIYGRLSLVYRYLLMAHDK